MTERVLFVDDDPLVLRAAARILASEPFETLTAGSAEEALDVLDRVHVQVVVSDENMPGMRGTALLAEVSRRHPRTVRVLMTGAPTVETAVRAINDGEVYRFVTKPVERSELLVTVRDALALHGLLSASWQLLRQARAQRDTLLRLEQQHPGIGAVELDSDGAVVLDESAFDARSLTDQIRRELDKLGD